MKKINALIILLLLVSNNAYPLNFSQSLTDVPNDDAVYAWTRCAGLSGFVYKRLENDGKNQLANSWAKMYQSSLKLASALHSKKNSSSASKSSEIILNRAVKMAKLYAEDSKELYLKNGNYLSGVIKDDMNQCLEMAEIHKKVLPEFFR